MIISGIAKNKVKAGCLFLLGSSVSAGAIVTEAKGGFLPQLAEQIKQISLPSADIGDMGLGGTFKSIREGLAQVPSAISTGATAVGSTIGLAGVFVKELPGQGMLGFLSNLGGGDLSSYGKGGMKDAIDIKEVKPGKIAKNLGTLGHNIILGGDDGDYKDLKSIKKFISENIGDNKFLKDNSKILAKALIMLLYAPTKTLNGINKRGTQQALQRHYKNGDATTITDMVLLEMDPEIFRVRQARAKKK